MFGNKATPTTPKSTEGFGNSSSKHECNSLINSSIQPYRNVKYRGGKVTVSIGKMFYSGQSKCRKFADLLTLTD